MGKMFLNALFICRIFCCFKFTDDHQLAAKQFRLQLQVLDHGLNDHIAVHALAGLFSQNTIGAIECIQVLLEFSIEFRIVRNGNP